MTLCFHRELVSAYSRKLFAKADRKRLRVLVIRSHHFRWHVADPVILPHDHDPSQVFFFLCPGLPRGLNVLRRSRLPMRALNCLEFAFLCVVRACFVCTSERCALRIRHSFALRSNLWFEGTVLRDESSDSELSGPSSAFCTRMIYVDTTVVAGRGGGRFSTLSGA